MKIREDLEGVVIVPGKAGAKLVTLAAGDEVPDGVEVGEHVLEPAEPVEVSNAGDVDDSTDDSSDDSTTAAGPYAKSTRSRK